MTLKKPFDAFTLKIIMLILMFFDHLYEFMFPNELYFMHILARLVAPVFAFFAAQSMVYTRNREQYVIRLFGFGMFMWLGNAIISQATHINIPNNIFFSLAIGAALVYFKDKHTAHALSTPKFAILAALLTILSMFCEGFYIVPICVLIFYYLRHNKSLMYAVYVVVMGLPYVISFAATKTLDVQFYMVFAVIPLMLYNGNRGLNNSFTKYLFYVFYPLHVWLIVLAEYFSK